MKHTGSAFAMYALGLKFAVLNIARGRIRRGLYLLIRPLDYWRTFEFPIAYEYLKPAPGERILDVGNPKLISMYTAAASGAQVYAMDVYDDKGLTDSVFFRTSTGTENLHVLIGDVRRLPFGAGTLDKVFSVSVLEHVFPAEGGDALALREIARVLRPGGRLVFSVPYVPRGRAEYLKQNVYDRARTGADDMVFYQRRYDAETLGKLLETDDAFEVERQEYISERLYHRPGKELWNVIGEGNKLKRLSLAPLYPVIAAVFLQRSPVPRANSEFMTACLSLRKRQ